MEMTRRTAAVVHLDRLERNIRRVLGSLAPGTELIAVVKGDAYGHGIAGVAPVFKACGVKSYAVSVWEEGRALRRAGCADEPILILGDTLPSGLPKLLKYRLTPTVFSTDTAERLDRLAAAAGTVQGIHIKLDTGMNRIGFPADERCIEPVSRIAAMKNLRIDGAFTHFSRADEPGCGETRRQLEMFMNAVSALRRSGVVIPMIHAANSPALLFGPPEARLDAVRVGDALFGLCPGEGEAWEASGLEEVMSWHTCVAMVKTVPEGTPVGYGGSFVTKRPTVIATLPVGFADGYSRRLSNRGHVSIHGRAAPVIGKVCMDMFMADVTDIPGVRAGDRAELIGGAVSVLGMADDMDANVDEVVCGISARVPKIYTAK